MAVRNPALAYAEEAYGLFFPEYVDLIPEQYRSNFTMATDAQPALVTTANGGIPAYLANYMDPRVIEVLIAPMQATEIFDEGRKGDWTTDYATFPVMEYTGQVAAYGDWSGAGASGANPMFPVRQSFHFQTITRWGQRQLDQAGLARIDWAGSLNASSARTLAKFLNQTYFFGVDGNQTYGILNDPGLPAAITPGTKAAGGVLWINGNLINATANEVYSDVQSLFLQLARQSQGLITMASRMRLCLSPTAAVALTATNSFNVSVSELVKKNFPNMVFVIAPEYSTTAGQLVQLIAEEVGNQPVGMVAFTEKMRTHPIIPGLSSFEQKKTGGTFGAILFQTFGIASMIGV